MASNLGRIGNILSVNHRRFATQTAGKVLENSPIGKPQLKQSKLPNGLQVIALEDYSPVCRIGVYIRAGPRCETVNNLGITHCLRNAAGLSTRSSTIFGITRNIDYQGGTFTATSTREDLVYRVENLRDVAPEVLRYLADTVTRPAFKPWEIKDYSYRMEMDVERLKHDPQALLMEGIHKAAFRGGLANSLYSPDYMLGHHDHNMLMHYFKEHYVAPRMAVVGVGIEHDQLLGLVEANCAMQDGDAKLSPSKFSSGEIRLHNRSDIVHAAVVAEGTSVKNLKDVLAFAVFQQALGCGPRIKYNPGGSRLHVAAAKVAQQPFVVSSLNLSYSDAGCFGFVVAGSADEIHTLVKALMSKLRETAKSLTEQDLQTAKHALKANVLLAYEDRNVLMDEMGAQALNLGQVVSVKDVITAIDGLKLQEVTSALSKLVKSKGAVAAIGKLHNMPHLEDLVAQ